MLSNVNNHRPVNALRESDVRSVYRSLLQREPESQAAIDRWMNEGLTLEQMIDGMIKSTEFLTNFQAAPVLEKTEGYARHNGRFFTIPHDLRSTDSKLDRVLLQGSCLLEAWIPVLRREGVETPVDLVLFTPDMPLSPPYPFEQYSYHIAQIPFRTVLFDAEYAEWLRTPYGDSEATEKLIDAACEIVDFWMERIALWAEKIPTFVTNYMTPQYNVNGRHFHNSDTASNVYVVKQINRHIEKCIAANPNLKLLDVDHLASVYGRRFIQDDSLWNYTHGGFIGDFDASFDHDRIVKVPAPSAHYSHAVNEFICTLWLEAEALYRIQKSIDNVKMVCIDLDDTIWRGVLAESENIDYQAAIEGWPLGITEALLSLRRRGIILALVSKNSLEKVKEIWPRVFQRRLLLDDFAILKVSWESKVQSINEAMAEANLLPRNVIFLDDNPRERQTVAEAIPELRVIHASHYYWKRILMWSAETQGYTITNESSRRSDMIKSQVQREAVRKTLSRDEFLARLKLKAAYRKVLGNEDRDFVRTLELLNKTNQFNTTGRRWISSELNELCTSGTVLVCEVSDRHAEYGLVMIGLASERRIEQVVMSCRVVGLDIEIATVSLLSTLLLAGTEVVTAASKDTDTNLLSRDLYEKCGWLRVRNGWSTQQVVTLPTHVQVTHSL